MRVFVLPSVLCFISAACDDTTRGGGQGSSADVACVVDSDCKPGTVCPQPPGEIESTCKPVCTPTSCAKGEICDPNGHCFPLPCNAGYQCKDGDRCDFSRADQDAHGCAVMKCDVDGYACPSGSHCILPLPAECFCPPHHCNFPNCALDVDVHGCGPDPCTQGAACPENFDCDPTSVNYATGITGCVLRGCSADSNCDCGLCVAGVCEDPDACPAPCTADSDCPLAAPHCSATRKVCLSCLADVECTGITPYCDTRTGTCSWQPPQ